MRKSEIEVGGRYTAKVSGKLVVVKIEGERRYPASGWIGRNESTMRQVEIRTAQRLRARVRVYDVTFETRPEQVYRVTAPSEKLAIAKAERLAIGDFDYVSEVSSPTLVEVSR